MEEDQDLQLEEQETIEEKNDQIISQVFTSKTVRDGPISEETITFDIGNLAAFNYQPLDVRGLKEEGESHLTKLARDSTQFLINRLFDLPWEKSTAGVLVTLPKGETIIPREKPVPKEQSLTKWQEFAKRKGIKPKTKEDRQRMVYDEGTDEWRPRWGYKRVNDSNDKWVVDAKETDDLNVDPFEKSKKKTEKSFNIARKSTISMGKFDKQIEGEVKEKEKKKVHPVSRQEENTKQMKVLDRILAPQEGSVDVTRAANKTILQQQKKRKSSKSDSRDSKRRKK